MMKKIELRCGQTTGNCEYSGERRGNWKKCADQRINCCTIYLGYFQEYPTNRLSLS